MYEGDIQVMLNKIRLDKMWNVIKNNIFIILIFFCISILSAIVLWRTHSVGAADDIFFHWSRIYDLRDSILNGNFMPKVALNKYYETGLAVMAMYPKLNLYPIVALSFFIKSFSDLVYTIFILKTFLALLIAYFSSYIFGKNKKVSFLFAVSYSLSTVMLFYSFRNMDMGVSSSLIFLPMVLFGTYELINNNKWKELTIGISFIIYCHLLTSVMTSLLVVIMLLINYTCFKKKEFIISLFKAVGSVLLITSIYWIPFLILLSKNDIKSVYFYTLSGTDINSFITTVFNNHVGSPAGVDYIYIDIFAFIGMILGALNYKRMSKYSKQMFWIAVAFIFLASSLVPWHILNNTFIKIIQFTWRLYLFPQLLFCYIFAVNVGSFCKNIKKTAWTIPLITLAILSVQITGQEYLKGVFAARHFDVIHVKKDNLWLWADYSPVKTEPVIQQLSKHRATYGNKSTFVRRTGNGKFAFKLKHKVSKLHLPFVIYDGIDYQVKVNGHNHKYKVDKYERLTVGKLSKGHHTVQVIVHKSWYDYLSYVLSALGIVILLFAWIREIVLKLKNK